MYSNTIVKTGEFNKVCGTKSTKSAFKWLTGIHVPPVPSIKPSVFCLRVRDE